MHRPPGAGQAFEVDSDGFGGRVELLYETSIRPGTWHFAEGTGAPRAWNVANEEKRIVLKVWIEGLGFTDVTDCRPRSPLNGWSPTNRPGDRQEKWARARHRSAHR
jgi:hypothetical protein